MIGTGTCVRALPLVAGHAVYVWTRHPGSTPEIHVVPAADAVLGAR